MPPFYTSTAAAEKNLALARIKKWNTTAPFLQEMWRKDCRLYCAFERHCNELFPVHFRTCVSAASIEAGDKCPQDMDPEDFFDDLLGIRNEIGSTIQLLWWYGYFDEGAVDMYSEMIMKAFLYELYNDRSFGELRRIPPIAFFIREEDAVEDYALDLFEEDAFVPREYDATEDALVAKLGPRAY